jgi:hypothetical protein
LLDSYKGYYLDPCNTGDLQIPWGCGSWNSDGGFRGSISCTSPSVFPCLVSSKKSTSSVL